ncbi:MAG: hypothetical protein KME54_04050 [Tolypothrix brevis GSE-NOS-MK-07-07A]|nr:hypothetical protein [Tolypothrix brevis GSE-NOS-MK-07-07A]
MPKTPDIVDIRMRLISPPSRLGKVAVRLGERGLCLLYSQQNLTPGSRSRRAIKRNLT